MQAYKRWERKRFWFKILNITLIILFLGVIGLTGWYVSLNYKDKLDNVETKFKAWWSTIQSLLILIMMPISVLSTYVKIRSIYYHMTKEKQRAKIVEKKYQQALNEPTNNEMIKQKQELKEMKDFQIKRKIIARKDEDRINHNLEICSMVRSMYPQDLRGTTYLKLKEIVNNFEISNQERTNQILEILKGVGITLTKDLIKVLNKII